MNYEQLINQSIGNVYQAGIATKILQHMGRIRNSSDQNQARRWVMELLQNARDVAWQDSMVKVKIELTEQTLTFSHTGKPFRVKDILSIVNQVSSKVDDENTVGQFGTGFVTTFQLSEQVRLEGVLKEEGLAYKTFAVDIDRRGETKDEILAGIERAMDVLKAVDDAESLERYDKDAFHTTFTYILDNANSRNTARIGMDDLRETIFFILLFSQKIGSVELKYTEAGGTKSICYTQGGHKKLGESLYIAEFFCTTEQEGVKKYAICYMEKDGMTLAANFCEKEGFLPMSEHCARIFIDFPLVGAERFCFPVVINDLRLQPNEPRSGISLVDNPNSRDAQINKKLMEMAVNNYREFLQQALAQSLNGISHIIKIPFYEPSKEMSEQWVKSHIYKNLYQFCASLPILETNKGKRALNSPNTYLLYAKTPEFLAGFREVLAPIADMYYSIDETDWYRVFEAYEPNEETIYSIEKLFADAEKFIRTAGKIDTAEVSVVKWCEKFCKLAWKDTEFARRIRAGELAVFPSQKLENGKIWYLKKLQEIRIDPGIPEILKDVTEILDEMTPFYDDANLKKCDLRENLLHKEFAVEEIIEELTSYEWSKLANYVETKSHENFKVRGFEYHSRLLEQKRLKVWTLLMVCGPDKEMYDMFAQFSETELPSYKSFETPLNERMWKNTYHALLKRVVSEIHNNGKKVENLRWYKNEKCPDIFAWLNLFYKKWLFYQYTNEGYGLRIYPDQEGTFKPKETLSWDKVEAKELKTIAYGLKELSDDCNFYAKLMHEKIDIPQMYLPECKNESVALTINQTVTRLLAQKNLADASIEHQEACSLLLAWIQNNPKEAEAYFAAYCSEEGMMKLLTPKAAVRMQKKINKLEEILDILECQDEEKALAQLKEIIKQKHRNREFGNDGTSFVFADGEVMIDKELLGDLSDCNEDETLRKVCRFIGLEGERYVFDRIKKFYQKQGLTVVSETSSEIKLTDTTKELADHTLPRTVTILYPDNVSYHQAGWDISITDSAKGNETDYIEIKTHTQRSYLRKQVRLSNEQMRFAIAQKEHYHVVVALYNYLERKGEDITVYDGVLKHIQNGRLKNIQNGYIYCV